MFAALLTSCLWALSAITGRRSALYLGSQRANLARQLIAVAVLGLWAHTLGQGMHGAGFVVLFLSGVIGFGIGDWALFEAYPRIGSALTILLCQCLAAPIAAVTEWLWLGTGMTWLQVASSVVILVGVACAISPAHTSDIPVGHRVAGAIFGVVAAFGQAWGAVLSRYAYHLDEQAGFSVDGITAAYQRLWGGVLFIGTLILLRAILRSTQKTQDEPHPQWNLGWPWTLANAMAGAVLGVSCYQWALKSTPSAIVLPIVATTPLIVMLIAFIFEGIRPPARVIAGGILAVTGVVTLISVR
jgi:drug/metabolite transporter (DMT)-like permease